MLYLLCWSQEQLEIITVGYTTLSSICVLSFEPQLQKFNKKSLKVSDEVTAYYIGRKDMGRLGVTQKMVIVNEAIRKHKAGSTKE